MKLRKNRTAAVAAVLLMICSGCSANTEELQTLESAPLVLSESSFPEGEATRLSADEQKIWNNGEKGGVKVNARLYKFSGFDGADVLNEKLRNEVESQIQELQSMRGEQIGEISGGGHSMCAYGADCSFHQNGDVLSVKLDCSYSLPYGSHDVLYARFFNVNMRTGEFYDSVYDIFQDPEQGRSALKTLLEQSLREHCADEETLRLGEANFQNIDEDYPFYLENDELFAYFEAYALFPGSSYSSLPVSLAALNEAAPLVDGVLGDYA